MLSTSGKEPKKKIADKNVKLMVETRNAAKSLKDKEKIIKI